MLKYSKGTVFNANTQAIVNTVNCNGFMGAGLALEFKLRYPDMFEDYASKCKKSEIKTGQVDYYKNQEYPIIINFPTKLDFRFPSNIKWIEQGLDNFVQTYEDNGIKSVAFPKLGTNNGGLDWNEVKVIMLKYLAGLDIDVVICLDNMEEAEGIEKNMISRFNIADLDELSIPVKLNAKQKDNIKRNTPYKRFWHIGKTKSIGAKTYSNLFKYYYDLAIGVEKEYRQVNLKDYLN